MILLKYPQSTTREYIVFLNHLMDLDTWNTQSLDVEIFPGFFRETRGIYGENGVSHAKAEGDVTYNPFASQCISASPTVTYPSRVRLAYSLGTTTANFGAETLASPVYNYLSALLTQRSAYKRTETGAIVSQWMYKNSDPTILDSFYRYNVTFRRSSASTLNADVVRTQFTGIPFGKTNINWSTLTVDDAFTIRSPGTETLYNITYPRTVYTVNSTVSPVKDVVVDLESICAHEYRLLNQQKHSVIHDGELAMRALESTDYIHTNMISFIKEIPDAKNLIPKLSNLKGLRGMKIIDSITDEYLSAKYGVLPTISDIKEIWAAFQKQRQIFLDQNGFHVASASHFDSQGGIYYTQELAQRLKLAIGTKEIGLFRLTEQLDHFGVLPNFSNIWDLVPYSFAIDWLVDVGSLLERADAQIRIESLPIKYCTRSRKKTRDVSMDALTYAPYGGSFQLVQYHRWVSALAPVPPLSLQAPLSLPQHLLEATALILQRRK